MKLVKKQGTQAATAEAAFNGAGIDRRTFLRRSGITAGGVAAASDFYPAGDPGRKTIRWRNHDVRADSEPDKRQ